MTSGGIDRSEGPQEPPSPGVADTPGDSGDARGPWHLDTDSERELIDLTKDLVHIPSSMRDGNEIYEFVADHLRKNGLEPTFPSITNPYMEYQEHTNLYLRSGGGGGPKIMLNCHLDTVVAREGWFHPPFDAVEDEGRIYGLGAADMKGGCAAAIQAAVELARRGGPKNGELFLSCVFGEEAPFSLGTDTLLREFDLKGYDLIIVTEPSPLLAINDYCTVHKDIHKAVFPVAIVGAEGRVLFEMEFFGRSAHASHPSQGVNVLHDAAKVIDTLAEFNLFSNIRMGRGHYAVINIEGGDETFTIPGYCKILVNRQLTLGETEKMVTTELRKVIRSLKLRSKVRFAKRFSPAPELEYRPYLSESTEFIARFMELLPKPKRGPRCRFTSSSVGDFNLFGTRTKSPVLVFGPGGGHIHAQDEYVNRQDVIDTTNYLLRFFEEVFG